MGKRREVGEEEEGEAGREEEEEEGEEKEELIMGMQAILTS